MVTIRDEKIADIAAREALLDVAYGAERFTKTSERLREGRLPADRLSLVAIDHGQLVGTVRLWHVTAGPGRAALLLGPLAVHPEHRNRGIGSALMRRAIARARLPATASSCWSAMRLTTAASVLLRRRPEICGCPGRFDRDRLLALELQPGARRRARYDRRGRPSCADARPRRARGTRRGATNAHAFAGRRAA